jgi:hypothetical protein
MAILLRRRICKEELSSPETVPWQRHLIARLINHGADLDLTCKWLIRGQSKVRDGIPSFGPRLFGVPEESEETDRPDIIRLSAAAVLQCFTELHEEESIEAPRACRLPPVPENENNRRKDKNRRRAPGCREFAIRVTSDLAPRPCALSVRIAGESLQARLCRYDSGRVLQVCINATATQRDGQ